MTAGKKLPSSPCDWGAWSKSLRGNPVDLIRERLGVKGTKIPATMHGEWTIDGWRIVVKRSPPKGRYKSSKHRIFVRHNGQLIPAGRVRQALCAVDVYDARERAKRQRSAKGRFTYRR